MSDTVATAPASAAFGAQTIPSVKIVQVPANPAPGQAQKIEIQPVQIPAPQAATPEEFIEATTKAPLVSGETVAPVDSLVATQNVAPKIRAALALAKGL